MGRAQQHVVSVLATGKRKYAMYGARANWQGSRQRVVLVSVVDERTKRGAFCRRKGCLFSDKSHNSYKK